jgi:peroxiredoxin/outer membrane lipoprotein-sorting protein
MQSVEFTTSFSAPNLFRLETKEDAIVGSTGERMYVYAKNRNAFLSADAPHDRSKSSDLPEPFAELIASQDPSVALAIASDPAAELQGSNASIEKIADVKIDGQAYAALKMERNEEKGVTTLLIDPQTHLIRRAIMDIAPQLAARGASDIKKAVITVDYSSITANPTTKPAQFAWAPPPGARDAQDIVDAGDASHLVGQPAPVFALKDLDDKEISLKDLKGSVVVLDFWASWCGPCVGSLPKINQLHEEFKEQGVKVFAVNQGEDKELVQGFMKSRNLSLPVLLDTDTKVGNQYDANAIPETVVIDKSGQIRNVFVGAGPDTESKLKEAIQAALHASK